jgi:hypothetical protein
MDHFRDEKYYSFLGGLYELGYEGSQPDEGANILFSHVFSVHQDPQILILRNSFGS